MALELTKDATLTEEMARVCLAVADASPMPMAGLEDDRQVIRYVNQAFCSLLGKSEEELLGRVFSEIVPSDDDCVSQLGRVYRTGLTETHQNSGNTADHSLFRCYAAWPVRNAESRLLGVMLQVTETEHFHQQTIAMNEALLAGSLRQHEVAAELNTQLKAETVERNKAFTALIRAEKLASLGRMAAAVAHEINNPLEAVTNVLFLARATNGLPESAGEYLKIADEELKRIAHITRQALGFYREPSTPTTFDIASLLNSVIDLVQAKINSKQAIVEKQFDEGLQITAYYGELRQVFSNLILNSLDAVGHRGRITLRARASIGNGNNRIRVVVADNGCGISAAERLQIFDPFFTTKGSIGTGLGLWVSKQLVDKHGGSIQVCSRTQGPQRGTTFSVALPVDLASLDPH